MKVRTTLFAAALAAAALNAQAASEFSVTLRNAGLARTISNAAGILKTTRLEANGARMLDQPSVEFLIEIEHDGHLTILAPSDFDVHDTSATRRNQEERRRLELRCTREGFPLIIYVDYYIEPRAFYQQKSIVVRPCAAPEGAALKRIVIEDMRFRDEFVPFGPPESVETGSEIGAIDPKANRGVFFFAGSPVGRVWYSPRRILMAWEELDTPLSKGHETGRVTIGSGAGSPDALYERFREFAWNAWSAARGEGSGADAANAGSGDFNKRFEAFKQRFQQYFAERKRVSTLLDGSGVDCEAYAVGSGGFLALFNPTRQARRVRLPLRGSGFELSGEVRLYDWTSLESGVPIRVAAPDDDVEIQMDPMSVRIIGVNIEE